MATGGGAVVRHVNWAYLHHGIVVWLDGPPELLARRAVGDGTAKRPMLAQAGAAAQARRRCAVQCVQACGQGGRRFCCHGWCRAAKGRCLPAGRAMWAHVEVADGRVHHRCMHYTLLHDILCIFTNPLASSAAQRCAGGGRRVRGHGGAHPGAAAAARRALRGGRPARVPGSWARQRARCGRAR